MKNKTADIKAYNKAYQKEYGKTDKCKDQRKRYYQAHKTELKAKSKVYHQTHKEKCKVYYERYWDKKQSLEFNELYKYFMTQILNRDKEIYSTLLFTKELILNPGIPKKQKIELIDKILDSIKN